MEPSLSEILREIKGLRKDMDLGFKEQKEEIVKLMDIRLKEQKDEIVKLMDIRLKEQKEEIVKLMDSKLKEQKDEILEIMEKRFDKQSKEIAQEFRNVVVYFEEKNQIVAKNTEEIRQEIKKNKVEHEGYNAKIYKLELGQSYIEEKVFEKEENKKIV